MSKRKRKSDRARKRREQTALQKASAPDQSLPPADSTPAEAESSGHREYAYVVSDLKRVTILAAALFALLIALSFFIG